MRVLVLTALVCAIAGLQMLLPIEGMNVFFLLDRSDSIPSPQQEAARDYVNKIAKQKKSRDKAGRHRLRQRGQHRVVSQLGPGFAENPGRGRHRADRPGGGQSGWAPPRFRRRARSASSC